MTPLSCLIFLFIIGCIVYYEHTHGKNNRRFEVVRAEFRKNISADIQLPTRATDGSAGYDIYSPVAVTIKPGESVLIWTDVKVSMNKNNVFSILPRSSVGIKKDVVLKNTVGIIDHDYYSNETNDGNIGLCLKNIGTEDQSFTIGERICQGIFSNYLITEDDSPLSGKRNGGIGSSGTK